MRIPHRQRTRRDFLRSIAAGVAGVGLCSQPLSLLAAPTALAWKAGLAKVPVTPRGPLWMAGYSSRTRPSEGVTQELYARALALQDRSGRRAVLLTSDIVGFPDWLSQSIAECVQKQYKLSRDRLLLNFSHTHGGPVIAGLEDLTYDMNEDRWSAVRAYARELEEKVVGVIGAALKDLRPARLSFGHAEADFAVNRRAKTEKGFVIGVNKEGPVDHDVPVLRVEGKEGRLRGIVFGYACHNTAAKDFMQFNGDYAGFAEAWLESHHPGATALFVAGCGGDINPEPRGTIELTRQHGETLAAAVDKAIQRPLAPVDPPFKSAFEVFPVAFAAPPSRQELETRLRSQDPFVRKHAQEMLRILHQDGRLPTEHPYPLQVWQFGSDLTLIALAGEVVVDYDLRLKRELGAEKLWVASYSNDVFAYIPSLRVLQEGGYEAADAMIYYGHPASFAPTIEETIVRKVHELVQRVRRESKQTDFIGRRSLPRFDFHQPLCQVGP